jgi:hypothetical protein
MGMENPVKAALRTDVQPTICQNGHDLTRWQRRKFRFVAGEQDSLALFSAGAAAVPAAAGVLHHVLDFGVAVAAPLAGEGAVAAASQGIRPLIERLFAGWSAERGRILAETLHDVVLGDGVEEIGRLASSGSRPELVRARQLLVECSRECG